jgi:phosphoribosylformimino-5-aminoimidazole carboxamide ribotide isomerase
MRFRPCIDLHGGKVKQIVGETLSDVSDSTRENFVSDRDASWYADLYRKHDLTGGHIVMLGPGNEEQARSALKTWRGGMQIGGGITAENAKGWLDAGASHVIVTSYVFYDGKIDETRLKEMVKTVGVKRLVLDLSCRKTDEGYKIVTNRWQTITHELITTSLLRKLGEQCAEFLVHAVDVEGKQSGIEERVVSLFTEGSPVMVTYAGGISTLADIQTIKRLGRDRVDYTVGSALDLFGGPLPFEELIKGDRGRWASDRFT